MAETKKPDVADPATKSAEISPAKVNPPLSSAAESADPDVHWLLSIRQAAVDGKNDALAKQATAELPKLGVQ